MPRPNSGANNDYKTQKGEISKRACLAVEKPRPFNPLEMSSYERTVCADILLVWWHSRLSPCVRMSGCSAKRGRSASSMTLRRGKQRNDRIARCWRQIERRWKMRSESQTVCTLDRQSDLSKSAKEVLVIVPIRLECARSVYDIGGGCVISQSMHCWHVAASLANIIA